MIKFILPDETNRDDVLDFYAEFEGAARAASAPPGTRIMRRGSGTSETGVPARTSRRAVCAKISTSATKEAGWWEFSA